MATTATGIMLLDKKGNEIATLWQHCDPQEAIAILTEDPSVISDWSGTWVPDRPKNFDNFDQYEIVTRGAGE